MTKVDDQSQNPSVCLWPSGVYVPFVADTIKFRAPVFRWTSPLDQFAADHVDLVSDASREASFGSEFSSSSPKHPVFTTRVLLAYFVRLQPRFVWVGSTSS